MEGAKLIGLRGGKAPEPYTEDIWARRPMDVMSRYGPRQGVDHGVDGKVVIKDLRTGFMLIWRPGHNAWVSRGQNGYYSSNLDFFGADELRSGLGKEICSGGRLNKTLMDREAEKIDKLFGYPLAHLYLHGHTVFIAEAKK